MGADARVDAQERMRERMHESCDWIGRSVTSVRTNQIRERIRERILGHAGADTRSCVTCLNQWECLNRERIAKMSENLTFDSNSTSAFFESDMLKINARMHQAHASLNVPLRARLYRTFAFALTLKNSLAINGDWVLCQFWSELSSVNANAWCKQPHCTTCNPY